MPLPGGPADKLGNDYEFWWTVRQLVRILHGNAERIRIEDPGVIKAEFLVTNATTRELHQAKRSHPDGKWTLASLGASDTDLLQAIFSQLSGNSDKFVFVSSSDAPELRELSERARWAESPEEFETRFLDAKVQKSNFEKLRGYWESTDTATSHDILRRIEVLTIDPSSLEDQVLTGLSVLFLTDRESAGAVLRGIAADSIHQTLTRDFLIKRMKSRGYVLRRLAMPDSAAPLVAEVTDKYLENARRKLIRYSLVPRTATQTLLDRINGATIGTDHVLTGKAGAGKTGCVIELVQSLRNRQVPVLAFRLDRLAPVRTAIALGQQLGLEESPALVLDAATQCGEAVLVADQLDIVSTTSGRSADLFDAVEGLLTDARALRERIKLHVVIVCRTFDWKNDQRLRKMLTDSQAEVCVTEFTPDEVKTVLCDAGFNIERFQPRQLTLLSLPQNLSLFLDADLKPDLLLKINTAKDLFDHYWDTKRKAVNERTAPQPDQWKGIIEKLCEEMTRTQQLSVRREKLDLFEPAYLEQMASEGVLTFDGNRYGFGHESFFDYCFARRFVGNEQPLAASLTESEQHLFRRAQARQVLAYLRDADKPRYCAEITSLLQDNHIRIHIKDLALATFFNVDDPGDDEWRVIEPWLNRILAALAEGQNEDDKVTTLVWRHFFTSASWFELADRRGLVAGWLASDNDRLTNVGVNYLLTHQRQFGETVARFIEPYVGHGGEWPARLRHLIEWAELHSSRRFFELFLRLVDDGTLDEARGPIAVNSIFWSMLYGLAEARPEWISEILAHWLRRRLVLVQQQKDVDGRVQWSDIFGHDDFGSPQIHKAAEKTPVIFVQSVLPIILAITDAAVRNDKPDPPRRDEVWQTLFKNEHESIDEACLSSLVYALQRIAVESPDSLDAAVASLRMRNTYIANFLLLNLYSANGSRWADEAALLLCAEPWRVLCGYFDSSYSIAAQIIRTIAPSCSTDVWTRLQDVILSYWPTYERGDKSFGHTQLTLLSAIPAEFRGRDAEHRFKELTRKFGTLNSEPRGIEIGRVDPPFKKHATDRMTDKQWLKAIAKYHTDNWTSDSICRGASKLADTLSEYVRAEPDRFAHLSLQFPLGTNSAYIEQVLDGLKDTDITTDIKLSICQKAFREFRAECGGAIASLLATVKDPLPDEYIQMLHWLATGKPDHHIVPIDGETRGPNDCGNIDSIRTRQRAAKAIGQLIQTDPNYIERFQATLKLLLANKSPEMCSSTASILTELASHDTPLAISLFLSLVDSDDAMLENREATRFVYCMLPQNYSDMRPYIERLLRSADENARNHGAKLACLAVLYNHPADDLVDEAMAGEATTRQGVAHIAAYNLAVTECRAWCEKHLVKLFNDDDAKVRSESAACFRSIRHKPLTSYETLISTFIDSIAFQENAFPLLHALENSLSRLPGITCNVCDTFFSLSNENANDRRSHRLSETQIVAKLIFRTYQQHERDEWTGRCLDLIDRMCLEGVNAAKGQMEEYER